MSPISFFLFYYQELYQEQIYPDLLRLSYNYNWTTLHQEYKAREIVKSVRWFLPFKRKDLSAVPRTHSKIVQEQ